MNARPRETVSIAKVAINAGMRVNVTFNPLTRPINGPVNRAASIASQTGRPKSLTNPTHRTDERASTAPTERSMPATRMTNASPIAMTANIVDEKNRFSMFSRDKNTGLAKLMASAPRPITTRSPRSWTTSMIARVGTDLSVTLKLGALDGLLCSKIILAPHPVVA